LQVSDQTRRLCDNTGLEETLGRFKSSGFVAQGFNKLAYAIAGQRVIIDDRDQWNLGHSSPGRKVFQIKTLIGRQFIFKKFDLTQLADGCRLSRFVTKATF
jgi:hypothetical protein